MYLVYLDESGNSGLNLADAEQPVFLLCAMVVAEERWQSLEQGLKELLGRTFPAWESTDGFEIHGVDLRAGRGPFKGMAVADRVAFRDAWMKVGVAHGVRLIHRHIEKRRYSQWLIKTFGGGVVINPHVAAFALVARSVDDYLAEHAAKPLGILISDENKEIVADVEKSIRLLRGEVGTVKLSQIIEKGFFIQSTKSLVLQLCDLYTLSLRKRAERHLSMPVRTIDDSGIQLAESILVPPNERFQDVIAWLTRQHETKKNSTP